MKNILMKRKSEIRLKFEYLHLKTSFEYVVSP